MSISALWRLLVITCSLSLSIAYPANRNGPAQPVVHAIGALFDDGGNVLTQGETKYFTVPFGCTVQAWNMTALPAGSSATIDVWKAAGAYPTASNSITGAATPYISGFLPIHSTDLSGWTTAVNQNDTFALYLSAVDATATQVSLVLQCQ